MLGYLSADIICSGKQTVFQEGNCELQGTDYVQGQLSKHIFAPNGGSFSWGIFSHVTCLDQSCACENI